MLNLDLNKIKDFNTREVFRQLMASVGPTNSKSLVGPKGDTGAIGPTGQQGLSGPPGGFETVAVSTQSAGVWQNVPLLTIVGVVDVVVYDQANREKVEIDTRINADNTVDIRSSMIKTYTVHVLGY